MRISDWSSDVCSSDLMKTALLAAIGAAAVTIASPALAQDEASSFNGPYVGVLGGYDNVGLNSSREDGVLYGGVIGYDINLGGAVFGVEGEYSDSDTKFRTERSEERRVGKEVVSTC